MARKRETWRGVEWCKVVAGRCTKHGCEVGPVTKLCPEGHREQMEAAANGSRQFERR